MEIISVDSKVFKELMNRLNTIFQFIETHSQKIEYNIDDEWVDNCDVCSFMHISEKTLYRLRLNKEISYTPIRGRYYYQIGEIKRMLEKKLIRSKTEHLESLIAHRRKIIEKIINKN